MLEYSLEVYSGMLGREVSKGMRGNAMCGLHNGGTPPFGYDVSSKKSLAINPDEAQIVKLVFFRFIDGRSRREIAVELTAKGLVTRKGNAFTPGFIRRMLRNEKYIGTYVFHSAGADRYAQKDAVSQVNPEVIRIVDAFPAIIDKATFGTAQERLRLAVKPKSQINVSKTLDSEGRDQTFQEW